MNKIFFIFVLFMFIISDTLSLSKTLSYNKSSVDFGSISYNSGSKFDTIKLSNKGTSTITIKNTYFIHYPDIFFISLNSAPPNRFIPQDTQLDIKIGASSSEIIGKYFDTLVIINDSDNEPELRIPVTFTVNPVNRPFSWDKSSIDFGRLYEGTGIRYDTVTFNTSSLLGLDILEIKFLSPNPIFNIFIHNAPPVCSLFYGIPFKIGISFLPLAKGTYLDTLCVKTSSIPTYVYIPVKVIVDTLSSIISPDKREINFGTLGYETEYKEEVINIRNISQNKDAVFTQAIFENNNNYFQVTNKFPFTIPKNGIGQIYIRFYPSETGNLSNTLQLPNNSMNEPNLLISLSGTVVGSNITVNPETINFGNVAINSLPLDTFFTITNTGNYKLKINSFNEYVNDTIIKITEQLPTPVILNPGESINLKIKLNPFSLGQKKDSIKINNNSSNAPEKTITISANILNPNLSITPQLLDFGTTKLDTPKKILPLYLINNGNSNITINNILIIDDTISFRIIKTLNSFTLSPGKIDSLQIEFFPRQIETKRGRLLIYCTDPLGSIRQINLKGEGGGKAILFVDKQSINFGDVFGGYTKDTTILIRNDGNINLKISSKNFLGTDKSIFSFVYGSEPIELQQNQTELIKIRILGQLPVGNKSAQLNFSSNDPDKPSYSINLSATIKAPVITLSHSRITFDTLVLGNYKDTVITVTNVGNVPLNISNIYFDGAFASDFETDNYKFPIILQNNENVQIKVRFKPQGAGQRFARIVFKSDDPVNQEIGSILIGYCKILNQPSIFVPFTSVNFGKVIINSFKDSSFTISNFGTQKLIIDSINIISGDKNYFSLTVSTIPLEINPGQSIPITIRFVPTLEDTSKIYQTNLRIKTNDPLNQILNISLFGTGYYEKNVLSYYPQKIDFDSIQLYTFKDTTITIINSGITSRSIESIIIEGNDKLYFSVQTTTPFTINPNGKQNIIIRFSPSLPDYQKVYNATVKIKTNDLFDSLLIVNLVGKAKYQGSLSSLFFSSNIIDFGKTTINYSVEKLITVKNIGNGKININSLEIVGKDSLYFTLTEPNSFPLSIESLEEKIIKLRFLPITQGSKNAILKVNSNDIVFPTFSIDLKGEGIVPKISTISSIHFGEVKINTPKDSIILITNVGEGILKITDLKISGMDSNSFSIEKKTNINEIYSSQSDTIYIKFTPKKSGNNIATLIILSNDISNSIISISLTGIYLTPKITVLPQTITFSNILVGKSKDSTILISNTGNVALTINSIIIEGVDSSSFSLPNLQLPIVLNPSQSKTIIIRAFSLISGVKNAYITINSDDPDLKYLTVPIIADFGVITKILNQTKDSIALINQEKTISFSILDNFIPFSVKIFYKLGGAKDYDSVNVSGQNGYYNYTFDKKLITERGLDYYIKIIIDGSTVTLPENDYINHPLCLRVKIPQIIFPNKMYGNIYYMLSTPFELEQNNFASEIFRLFGKSDPYQWRLLRWENDNYKELTESNLLNIKSSNGFWVISSKQFTLDFNNALTNLTNEPFKITLQPGWNQIGNPFMFPISLNNITFPYGKNVEQVFWKWNQNYYIEENNSLEPFTGYFIINNESYPVDIFIKPILSDFKIASNSNYETEIQNNLKIEFTINDEKDNKDNAVIHKINQENITKLNISKPPVLSESSLDIRIIENKREYKSIAKESLEKVSTILLQINNLKKGNNYTLFYNIFGTPQKEFEIIPFDAESGAKLNFVNKKIQFKATSSTKCFKICIGDKNSIDNETNQLNITEYRLLQNFPNPFNPSTKIEYYLPYDNYVSLKIFNSLGQEVETLIEAFQQKGRYSVIWNARNMPSGIYYYKLNTDKYNSVRKMLLLK